MASLVSLSSSTPAWRVVFTRSHSGFLKKRELAELLIKCGADTSSVDRDGDSALIYAVKMGYLKTAETLMKTAPARQCKKVLFIFEKMKKRPDVKWGWGHCPANCIQFADEARIPASGKLVLCIEVHSVEVFAEKALPLAWHCSSASWHCWLECRAIRWTESRINLNFARTNAEP